MFWICVYFFIERANGTQQGFSQSRARGFKFIQTYNKYFKISFQVLFLHTHTHTQTNAQLPMDGATGFCCCSKIVFKIFAYFKQSCQPQHKQQQQKQSQQKPQLKMNLPPPTPATRLLTTKFRQTNCGQILTTASASKHIIRIHGNKMQIIINRCPPSQHTLMIGRTHTHTYSQPLFVPQKTMFDSLTLVNMFVSWAKTCVITSGFGIA